MGLPVLHGSSALRHASWFLYSKGTVIVQPPQVDNHRWKSTAADRSVHGLTPLDDSTRAILRQLSWRTQSRDHRGLWLSLALVLLLHGFFGWFVWSQMHPEAAAPRAANTPPQNDNAIEIRFLPRRAAIAVAPPPAMPSPPQQPRLPPSEVRTPAKGVLVHPRVMPKTEPPAKDAMTVQLPATRLDNTSSPKLFDENGQPLLPASATSTPPKPEADYVERMPTDSDKVMQHSTPIKYTPTRFDKYWHKSSTVDDALQKAVDATTVKKTIDLPKGVHIHCSISLAMLAGGCGGDPPPPPSKKDGDERLSMAPSQQFGKDPHPPTPPTVAACIAMYRAQKPLEQGCPIDTPNRSVDAEKAEAAAKIAGRKP